MACAVVACSLTAASASARGGKIKLTAEVLRLTNTRSEAFCPEYPNEIGLFRGKKQVGSLKVGNCAAAGFNAYYHGTAKLEVGSLSGKLHFELVFSHPPTNSGSSKPGKGTFSNAEGSELFQAVTTELPPELGARFTVILDPRVVPN
ncbi:MAG TPA: hypothetical protein VGG40_08620 [Solirubrobacterales bacterium]